MQLSITEAHRNIWKRIDQNPELARVIEENVDLAKSPVTRREELFVLSVLFHLDSVRALIEEGSYPIFPGLEKDVRAFLALPIPHYVVSEVIDIQPPAFQAFLKQFIA